MIRKNQIWKIYGTDFKDMTKKLLEGTELSAAVREKAASLGRPPETLRIGIKPNLVTPSPADFGGTTHPEVIAGIIEYLKQEGFSDLTVLESSWVGDRTSDAFEYCGYNRLAEEYNVPLVDTKKDGSHKVDCGGGMELSVVDTLGRIDFLINVPVMKGHCQTKVTCALKNLKGLIPDSEKRRFHRMGLHKPIAYLQKAIHQDFIVIDHICGDLDFEEGGNPVVRNCIMAALDPVLTDSYVCRLIGYTPDEVPYVRLAEKLGIGSADLGKAEIINLNKPAGKTRGQDEELPRERRILDVAYKVDAVDSCSACYGMLVSALYRLNSEGLLSRLSTPIGIGQGMQGRTGKLGIGKCTKDFDFCIMGCPPDEEKIYNGLKEYILKEENTG